MPVSAYEIVMTTLAIVGPVLGGLFGFKLRGKAPPSGDRLR